MTDLLSNDNTSVWVLYPTWRLSESKSGNKETDTERSLVSVSEREDFSYNKNGKSRKKYRTLGVLCKFFISS